MLGTILFVVSFPWCLLSWCLLVTEQTTQFLWQHVEHRRQTVIQTLDYYGAELSEQSDITVLSKFTALQERIDRHTDTYSIEQAPHGGQKQLASLTDNYLWLQPFLLIFVSGLR